LVLVALDLAGIFLIGVVVSVISGTIISPSSPLFVALRWIEERGFVNAYAVILGVAIGFFVLKGVASFLLTYLTASYVGKIEARKAKSIYQSILNGTLDDAEEMGPQELLHGLTNSINAAFGQTIVFATAIAGEVALLVGVSLYLAYTNLVLFIFVAVFFAIVGAVMQLTIGNFSSKVAKVQNVSFLKSQSVILDSINNFRQIAAAANTDAIVRHFDHSRSKTSRASAVYATIGTLPRYITEVSVMIGVGILVFQRSIDKGESFSSATIAVFLAGIFRIVASMLPLQSSLSAIKSLRHEASQGLYLANKHLIKSESSEPQTFSGSNTDKAPRIELLDVSFKYPGQSKPAVSSVTISIPGGSYMALLGRSGAGKSTLVDLILGLRLPSSGQILIDGVPSNVYRHLNPNALGYVPQSTRLIAGTMLENITLKPSHEGHDAKRMAKALIDSGLEEVVASLGDGLNTFIGPGGISLSGGQTQRIGLARALYIQPKVLVLDEATSALDRETEIDISHALANLKGKVTCIVIAHRPETIKVADIILELARGSVSANEASKLSPT
jgi:ABC-type multidrug transport system fused ATPase/permease subunit